MPTYEYECTKGHQFEVEQRITEAPLTRCKICKAKAIRLISGGGFILKGGGWYNDGYSSSRSNGSGSSGGEASKPAGCSGGACGAASSSGSCGD